MLNKTGMTRSRRFKRKKGPVRSKKVEHDGIKFQSGLEKHMYIALKKAKIKSHYEGQTYELVPSFNFEQEAYERQGNGKGEYRNSCLLYTSPSPRDRTRSRMPSSA